MDVTKTKEVQQKPIDTSCQFIDELMVKEEDEFSFGKNDEGLGQEFSQRQEDLSESPSIKKANLFASQGEEPFVNSLQEDPTPVVDITEMQLKLLKESFHNRSSYQRPMSLQYRRKWSNLQKSKPPEPHDDSKNSKYRSPHRFKKSPFHQTSQQSNRKESLSIRNNFFQSPGESQTGFLEMNKLSSQRSAANKASRQAEIEMSKKIFDSNQEDNVPWQAPPSKIDPGALSGFEKRRLEGTRRYLLILHLAQLILNFDLTRKFNELSLDLLICSCLYWVAFIINSIGLYLSYRGHLKFIYGCLVIEAVRAVSIIFFVPQRGEVYPIPSEVVQMFVLMLTIQLTTMITNLFFPYKHISFILLTGSFFIGACISLFPSWDYFLEHWLDFLQYAFYFWIFQIVYYRTQTDVASELKQEIQDTQKQKLELQVILDNLEEGIIIYDKEKETTDYCNYCSQQTFQQALEDDAWSHISNTSSKRFFSQVGQLKLFQEYTNAGGQVEGPAAIEEDQETMSLAELIEQTEEERSKKVYTLPIVRQEQEQQQGDISLGDAVVGSRGSKKYVQIKRKYYMMEGQEKHLVQIIDISKSVLYDQEHAKSELLALINVTVSHEMRNPLNSILSLNVDFEYIIDRLARLNKRLLVAAKRGSGDVDELLQFCATHQDSQKLEAQSHLTSESIPDLLTDLERIQRVQKSSSNLLLFFVNDIIDFSRIRSNKFQSTNSKFNVEKAVAEMVEVLKFQAEKQKTKIMVHLDNFERFGGEVLGDRQRLQQVLLNLLSNALKFTQKGKIFVKVGARFNFEQQCWVLKVQVRDTGLGMTRTEQKKLFKLFGVLKSTKEQNSKGIGLGLVICKMIVEQLGGSIGIESKKGAGALFYFSMKILDSLEPTPADKLDFGVLDPEDNDLLYGSKSLRDEVSESVYSKSIVDAIEPVDEENLQIFTAEAASEVKILVVDDYNFNIEALKVLLRISGVNLKTQVHEATNGMAAIHQVIYQPEGLAYDLIFMDCNMPKIDGYQATLRIRKECEERQIPQPKILAVTGHTEEQYLRQATQSGMDGIFSKPICLDQIREVLGEFSRPALSHQHFDSQQGRDIGLQTCSVIESDDEAYPKPFHSTILKFQLDQGKRKPDSSSQTD